MTATTSYWDVIQAIQCRNLAEQLLTHSSHYPACTGTGFGTACSIKHPDCFWCGVGAHLDCDYDFLQKTPNQKLDEIASFAAAFFRRDCYYLPNNPSNTENGNECKTRGNMGTDAKNGSRKGDPS